MGWKDWPYWLKGGIVSLIFLLIFIILNFILIFLNLFDGGSIRDFYIYFHTGYILVGLMVLIFGAITGKVYGKIGWESWSYTKKGVMLALALLLIQFFVNIIGIFVFGGSLEDALIAFITPVWYLMGLVILIVGAIIGWIYGKIKQMIQRRQNG